MSYNKPGRINIVIQIAGKKLYAASHSALCNLNPAIMQIEKSSQGKMRLQDVFSFRRVCVHISRCVCLCLWPLNSFKAVGGRKDFQIVYEHYGRRSVFCEIFMTAAGDVPRNDAIEMVLEKQ